MKRLAILDDYEHAALESADWKRLAGDVDVTVFHEHVSDLDSLERQLKEFELIFLMRERTAFPRALFERLPKLEHLITSGMRNASIDLSAATDHDVLVTGTPILAHPPAEHTWALILSLTKRIVPDVTAMREGRWDSALSRSLRGRTLGVIGVGRQGSQVARIASVFGMNVIAWSQNLTREICAEVGAELVSRSRVFSEADIVTLHLQLSERTRGLVGRPELQSMKSDAYLVNTSRGPIIEETALIEALEAGNIAGAALDVFDVEPLPADHPLRRAPNVILTPHTGYVTDDNYAGFYSTAIANIRAWLDGAPLNRLA
jgi:phosphoglycerate dehydrogenase-like enzyme